MKTYNWIINIKTVSEANSSEHWSSKSKRHKIQQEFVKLSFAKYVKELTLPCEVTLTRLSPRILDDDNLVMSMKWIRDELSGCILPDSRQYYLNAKGKTKELKGRVDSDERIKWRYGQEKSQIQGVSIEIKCDD